MELCMSACACQMHCLLLPATDLSYTAISMMDEVSESVCACQMHLQGALEQWLTASLEDA